MKIYTIYQLITETDYKGQERQILRNITETINREELAKILNVGINNLSRYKTTYNATDKDTETDYTINATKEGLTYIIDYD